MLATSQKVIVINAGHHAKDPGKIVTYNGAQITEFEQCKKIRDEIKTLSSQLPDFRFYFVDDSLTLPQSIAYANVIASKLDSGFVIDIHLNANSKTTVAGCEAYYGISDKSKSIAKVMSRNISNTLNIKDRGAISDKLTAVGSLGWIRQTKAIASLVEVCYMTNEKDLDTLMNDGHKKAAIGILNGICELYQAEAPDWTNTEKPIIITPEPTVEPLSVSRDSSLLNALLTSIFSIINKIFKHK